MMNGCLLIFSLLFGMALYPYTTKGQNSQVQPISYNFGGGGNTLTSNVPLNEINIHAFRHFRKRFPAVLGETWTKVDKGYIVSFTEHAQRNQARFDSHGGFLYSLKYYAGEDVPGDLSGLIKRRYPDYLIDVVTEISDGEKVFFLVKIENSSSVKTLSVTEGRVEVFDEVVNGGVRMNPGK
jgi:hypothetical protein